MISAELENYLKNCRDSGAKFDEVEKALSIQGYSSNQISEAGQWYNPVVPKTKIRKPLAVVLLMLAIFLLAGTGAAAYLVAAEKIKINNPGLVVGIQKVVYSIPFVPKTPKMVILKAVEAHKKISRNTWELSISGRGMGSELGEIFGSDTTDLLISGYSDFSDSENVRFKISANLGKEVQVELRKKDKILYANVSKMPLAIYAFIGLEPDKVKLILANWIAIDVSGLNTEARNLLSEIPESSRQSQTQETTQEILEKLLNEEVIPLSSMTTDKSQGYAVYKIVFRASPEQLDRIEEAAGTDPGRLKFSEWLKNPVITLFIDKEKNLVRRAEATFTIDYDQPETSIPLIGSGEEKADVAVVLKLDNFVEEMIIDVPDKSLTPDEFYQMVMDAEPGGLLTINPDRQLARVRDAKRRADISAILSATYQFTADNRGILPVTIGTEAKKISESGANLCKYLVPEYLAAFPIDPRQGDGKNFVNCPKGYDTGYTIFKDKNDRITILAPMSEGNEIVTVTR